MLARLRCALRYIYYYYYFCVALRLFFSTVIFISLRKLIVLRSMRPQTHASESASAYSRGHGTVCLCVCVCACEREQITNISFSSFCSAKWARYERKVEKVRASENEKRIVHEKLVTQRIPSSNNNNTRLTFRWELESCTDILTRRSQASSLRLAVPQHSLQAVEPFFLAHARTHTALVRSFGSARAHGAQCFWFFNSTYGTLRMPFRCEGERKEERERQEINWREAKSDLYIFIHIEINQCGFALCVLY